MNESPQDWLERQFEFHYCDECGRDHDQHTVIVVLGNYFALCSHPPIEDSPNTLTLES